MVLAAAAAARRRRRTPRRALLALLLGAGVAAAGLSSAARQSRGAGEGPGAITLEATPLSLSRRDGRRSTVGRLSFVGGWALRATDTGMFGGLSGLVVAEDGRWSAVSDAGDLVRGEPIPAGGGRVAAQLTPLTDAAGQPFARKIDGDAEDLAPAPDGGLVVSFEQTPRLVRYDAEGRHGRELWRAADGGRSLGLRPNAGLEGLARCPSGPLAGAWLMGAESGRIARLANDGLHPADIGPPPPDGLSLTGLSCTASGRLFALYRAPGLFGDWRALVAELAPGPRLRLQLLARLEAPLEVDNLEGISARDLPGGAVRLHLISDDNFGELPRWLAGRQRTLLLAFDLPA